MSECGCGDCEKGMTVEQAREKYTVVKVHPPTLDANMRPAFRLLNVRCSAGKDGECHKCEDFVGAYSEDGTFFAHGTYEGFCKAGVLPVKEEAKEDEEYHRQAAIDDVDPKVFGDEDGGEDPGADAFVAAIHRDAAAFENDPIEKAHGHSGAISPALFKKNWLYRYVRFANGVVRFGDACAWSSSHKQLADEYMQGPPPGMGEAAKGHPAPPVFAGKIKVRGKKWRITESGSTTLKLPRGNSDEKYIDRTLSQSGFKYDPDLYE